MKNNMYIFDIDGTLTPSRQKMDKSFLEFFKIWAMTHKFYLVTGSDIANTREQLPLEVMSMAQGIYCCCGNEYYIPSSTKEPIFFEKQYALEFDAPNDLTEYLLDQLETSTYPKRCGNHIEKRNGMLNFSIVGRNCNLKERKDFFEWDNKFTKRDRIAAHIRENWTEIDASLGGQISIDIYPKGKDKSQVLEKILKDSPDYNYVFVADRAYPGGNDYPLAKVMDDRAHEFADCDVKQVDSWEDTMEYLKTHQ